MEDDNIMTLPHLTSYEIVPTYYQWGDVTIQNSSERYTLDVKEDITAFEVWNLIKFLEEGKMNTYKDVGEHLIVRLKELNLERLFKVESV